MIKIMHDFTTTDHTAIQQLLRFKANTCWAAVRVVNTQLGLWSVKRHFIFNQQLALFTPVTRQRFLHAHLMTTLMNDALILRRFWTLSQVIENIGQAVYLTQDLC